MREAFRQIIPLPPRPPPPLPSYSIMQVVKISVFLQTVVGHCIKLWWDTPILKQSRCQTTRGLLMRLKGQKQLLFYIPCTGSLRNSKGLSNARRNTTWLHCVSLSEVSAVNSPQPCPLIIHYLAGIPSYCALFGWMTHRTK